MIYLFRAYFSPMLGLFLLTIGASLLTTLQTVILHDADVSSAIIGIITAAYYLGFVYAAFSVEKFILRVAHIRAYATFAALFSSLIILQGIFKIPMLWLLIRLMAGFCSAGLFVVIESWMLSESTPTIRSQALAAYMIVYYGAQVIAQLFLNLGYENILLLFAIAAMLCSLSIVPLAVTKSKSPEIGQPSFISFKILWQQSSSGVIGCFISGILTGPIYGLLPIYISSVKSIHYVAPAMAICILGGMLCQYPFGRLSDKVDRRSVIASAFAIIFITSIILLLVNASAWLWYLLLFALGGAAFVIYPISMSHACEIFSSDDMITATQGLVLANSIGMILGPLFSALLITYFKPRFGFLLLFIATGLLMTFFFLWRLVIGKKIKREQEFIAIPRITPVAMEIDPRIDDES